MPNRISKFLEDRVPVLFKESMPVWLTIFASLLASVGAYYLSPAVNREFEIDKARSAHIAKTTDDLNSEIIVLSQKVRRLNDALVNKSPEIANLRADCLDHTTKLQWMLIDLKVVLKSSGDQAAVDRLGTAIASLKKTLERSVDERAEAQLLGSMGDVGVRTRDVLDRLYVKASLK